MKVSDYRQRLRDAFYERLKRKQKLRGDDYILWSTGEVRKRYEEASEQVLLEMLEEAESGLIVEGNRT